MQTNRIFRISAIFVAFRRFLTSRSSGFRSGVGGGPSGNRQGDHVVALVRKESQGATGTGLGVVEVASYRYYSQLPIRLGALGSRLRTSRGQ